jgi:hypothetical protein
MKNFRRVKEEEVRRLLIEERFATLSHLEPRAVPPKQSDITASPLDRVTFILIQY